MRKCKWTRGLAILICGCMLVMLSCKKEKGKNPEDPGNNQGSEVVEGSVVYEDLYDPISDQGQYDFLGMTKEPKLYWNCSGVVGRGDINNVNLNEINRGLQYHLLAQSVAGLANKAVIEGRSEIGVWLGGGNLATYNMTELSLGELGIIEYGERNAVELATQDLGGSFEGVNLNLRDLFDGYVLTDIVNSPESNNVASVAATVKNGIIVDVRDKEYFDNQGYKMVYDARNKTIREAWNEFKNELNNKALVVMPNRTGALREYAICNGLFVLNVLKLQGNPSSGNNFDLLDEVLDWLEPGAPVFGWGYGIAESDFVNRASRKGHPWIAADLSYNLPFTSLSYKTRQRPVVVKTVNPKSIDYERDKKFVSFFLTDGDNVQWQMNDFVESFYDNPDVEETRMAFGISASYLNQMAPDRFYQILEKQRPSSTLMEYGGGGYIYPDNYANQTGQRPKLLKQIAEKVGHDMRQHGIKVLGIIVKNNFQSEEAKEAYQAYIDANDQLEGIVSVPYNDYGEGKGAVLWLKNKKGMDIPIVTPKYDLRNMGNRNGVNGGTPSFVAQNMKFDPNNKYNLIDVHAWSNFRNIGDALDAIGENNNGNLNSASAAKLVMNHLSDEYEAISVQEFVWRLRMEHNEEQTKKYLQSLK